VATKYDKNKRKTLKRIMNYKEKGGGGGERGRPKIRWIDIVNTGMRRQVLKTVDRS
jgi:hypothetical protein